MALRLIEMRLAGDHSAEISDALDEVPHVDLWNIMAPDGDQLWHILARGEQVEALVDALEEHFSKEEGFRLIVFNIEAVIPRPEDEEEPEREREQAKEPEGDQHSAPINIEELYEDVTHGMELTWGYAAMVGASAVVAAVGVFRNDLVLLIGAMIIAPLLHPNMALSLATTMADLDLGKRALKVGGLGALVTVLVAVAFGLLLPFNPSPAMASLRTTVGLLDVAVAASAGAAGALSFTTVKPSGIVGVMIAAALLPPLVSFGMLMGAGHLQMAVAPFLLVLVNVICINLSGVVTFFVQRIRPRARWEEERARHAFRRALAIWLGLLGVLVALGYFAGHYWTILL